MHLTVMWNWEPLFQRVLRRDHSPMAGALRRGCKDEIAVGAQLRWLAPSTHLSATEKRMKSNQLVSEIRWDRVPSVGSHGDARAALASRRAEVLPSTHWMPTAATWSDICASFARLENKHTRFDRKLWARTFAIW
jgi:hypothetical protein